MLRQASRAGQQGVTLVEVMMVLAIMGIIAGFSAPYLQDTVKNWRITSQTNDLLADLTSARGQAAAKSLIVTVCASTDGATCGTDWSKGRLVFTDANGDAAISAGDALLRFAPAINTANTLTVANLSTTGRIQFRSTGMASGVTGAGATFKFCDDRSGAFGRLVTVALTGRAATTTVSCP